MQQRARSIVRVVFLTIGALFALSGIGTIALWTILQPPGDHSAALRGGFVYLAIASISLFTAWRCRPPQSDARGFEVGRKPGGDVVA